MPVSDDASGVGPGPRRVMILGLDGGTLDLLRPWIAGGELPVLARLVQSGVSGYLRSTMPPITAAAWPSLVTGKNPGKHGLVDFVFPREDYSVAVANASHRDEAAIWDILGSHDKRSIVVGMPVTYPPQRLQGYMVSGFMTPGSDVDFTYPVSLKDELLADVGEFPFAPSEDRRFGPVEHFLEDMIACARRRTKTTQYLMRKGEWSLLALVFSSTDMVQHELWPLLDEQDPRHDPERAAELRPAVLGFYRAVDACLGELIEEAGPGTLTVIMSDHGFGPCLHFIHLNNWLHQLGLLRFKRTPWCWAKQAAFRAGFTPLNVLKVLDAIGLGRLRENVKCGQGYGLLSRVFLSLSDVDWSRTKAFASGSCCKVYFNLADRFPQGMIHPGREYDELKRQIMDAAPSVRNPINGEPVFEKTYCKEEMFSGHHAEELPDLILGCTRGEYTGFGHADFGSNQIVGPNVGQPGDHRMNGMLVMSGDGIRGGEIVENARIIDLAPTILCALGLPVPRDMDGEVLSEAFTGEALEARPVTYGEETSSVEDGLAGYTDDEEQKIKQRLRGMGYVA